VDDVISGDSSARGLIKFPSLVGLTLWAIEAGEITVSKIPVAMLVRRMVMEFITAGL
jgi:hypothetical protein